MSSLLAQAFRVQEGPSIDKQLKASCVRPWLPADTACAARSLAEMPALPAEAVHRVQYASSPIVSNGLGTLSTVLSFTHSALVVTEVMADGDTMVPTSVLFEYFALSFGPSALLPTSLADGPDGTPTWDNQAVVGWRSLSDDDKGGWFAKANVNTVGTATGKTLNQWFPEVVAWGQQHPSYGLFAVWDRTDVANHISYVDESICHSFTEWGLKSLFKLGADFSAQEPLCRNYFSFISHTRPTLLDLSLPVDKEAVMDFYGSIQPLASSRFHNVVDFASTVLKEIQSERREPKVVLFRAGPPGNSNSTGSYFEAPLVKPYLGVKPDEVSQRMILPWQSIPSNIQGECESMSLCFFQQFLFPRVLEHSLETQHLKFESIPNSMPGASRSSLPPTTR